MGVIITAIVLAVSLAAVAGGAYYAAQEPVYEAQARESVRVGDPGHNLVGPTWSGNVPVYARREAAAERTGQGPTGANQ